MKRNVREICQLKPFEWRNCFSSCMIKRHSFSRENVAICAGRTFWTSRSGWDLKVFPCQLWNSCVFCGICFPPWQKVGFSFRYRLSFLGSSIPPCQSTGLSHLYRVHHCNPVTANWDNMVGLSSQFSMIPILKDSCSVNTVWWITQGVGFEKKQFFKI